ncbi:GSCOCG00003005001-RA-CDS [Cotesia congregata]|nr:GSCOCG00003005001-RA-CDS [Cotesia congregata]
MIAKNILKANKQATGAPNLKQPRSRTSSMSDSDPTDGAMNHDGEEFLKPRKPAKIRRTLQTAGTSTNNKYDPLTESDLSDSETTSTNKRNHKGKKKISPKLNIESNQQNSSQNVKSAQMEQNKIPKSKPPPIFAKTGSIKDTTMLFTTNNVPKTNFIVREFDDNYIRIYPNDIATYDLSLKILKEKKIQFFTYTPRHLKIKTIVLKGVRGGYDENDVKAALTELNLQDITITKVSKLIFDRSKPQLFHFLVSVSQDSKTATLTRLKSLLSQPIRWERLRRPTIFMCKKCQQTGHSSSNCHMAPVCVKCAGEHEAKDCTLQAGTDKKFLRCTNCDEIGHPASYKGCPALKLITKIKIQHRQQNEAKKRNLANAINKYTNPDISYANMFNINKNNSFPPLPRPKVPLARVQTASNINPITPADTNYQGNITDSLESILNSFKNDIVKEIKQINYKINLNANRIDIIMSSLGLDE